MIISVFDRVETIVGKAEIACTRLLKRLLSLTRHKVSLRRNGLTQSMIHAQSPEYK